MKSKNQIQKESCANQPLRCWKTEAFGVKAKVYARTRGRARFLVALALHEADFTARIGEGFSKILLKHFAEGDSEAENFGKECILSWPTDSINVVKELCT